MPTPSLLGVNNLRIDNLKIEPRTLQIESDPVGSSSPNGCLVQVYRRRKVTSLILSLLFIAGFGITVRTATHPLDALTLEQAISIAERQHPELLAAHAAVDAATGRLEQAGRLPNPELIIGAQQLALESNSTNQREIVAGFAQPIPLGTRLSKARQAELFEKEVRLRGLEVTRRTLHKRIRAEFATALYQEEALQSQQSLTQSHEQSVKLQTAKLNFGDSTPDSLAQAEMELARAQLELRRTQTLRDQSRVALSAAIGDSRVQVNSLSGNLEQSFDLPSMETFLKDLPTQPELLQSEANVKAAHVRMNLAKAETIPDIKVEVLYHRLESTRDNTLDIGLSIPLPLFNRNQGRVREARAEATAAEARLRITNSDINARILEAHSELALALATAKTFKGEILPRATTVLKSFETRYAAGDIGLEELLPIRRNWAALQISHLELLRNVMKSWANLRTFSQP